jgi:hypothetical protein
MTRIRGALHQDLCTFTAVSRWIHFRTKLYRKSKDFFMSNNVFFWKSCRFWDDIKNIVALDRSQMTYKVVQIWPGLIFFKTIIARLYLVVLSTTKQVLTRAGGRVEFVASLSQGRTAAAQCGLFTHKSVPVIFELPCVIRHMRFAWCITRATNAHSEYVTIIVFSH